MAAAAAAAAAAVAMWLLLLARQLLLSCSTAGEEMCSPDGKHQFHAVPTVSNHNWIEGQQLVGACLVAMIC